MFSLFNIHLCNRFRSVLLLTFLFFSLPNDNLNAQKLPASFQAKVIKVKDGDTIEVLYNTVPLTIRLAHIDCPEKKQPYGNVARQYLANLCFGKIVVVRGTQRDRNRRLIAEISLTTGSNINKTLVAGGMAWHFKRYSTDTSYAVLELGARSAHLGLWNDAHPIAPWDWRPMQRRKK